MAFFRNLFLELLKDCFFHSFGSLFFFFHLKDWMRSGDTPDRRVERWPNGAAMYFFFIYLGKRDMLNANRFKDLTEAQFCWLGLTAVSVCVLFLPIGWSWHGLIKKLLKEKHHMQSFFFFWFSLFLLCPVSLFLLFLFPFVPRKENCDLLFSAMFFFCLCFKSCEVLRHPWRQSTSWGKSVAETAETSVWDVSLRGVLPWFGSKWSPNMGIGTHLPLVFITSLAVCGVGLAVERWI